MIESLQADIQKAESDAAVRCEREARARPEGGDALLASFVAEEAHAVPLERDSEC